MGTWGLLAAIMTPIRWLSFSHALVEFTRLKGNKTSFCASSKRYDVPRCQALNGSFNNATMDDLTSCKIYCNPSPRASPGSERHASFPLTTPWKDSHVNPRVQPKGVILPQGVSLTPSFAHFFARDFLPLWDMYATTKRVCTFTSQPNVKSV